MIFFFSYAKADRNPYLDQFYEDIVESVRSKLGLNNKEHVAFRDEEKIEPGKLWSEELIKALCECQIFLYLHSPTYFKRPSCGREFVIFKNRLEEHLKQFKEPPKISLIQPVIWIPTKYNFSILPKEIIDLQFTHGEYGDTYKNEGLQYLIKVERKKYEKIINQLSKRICSATESVKLPKLQDIIKFEQIKPLFPTNNEEVYFLRDNITSEKTVGPRYAQFLFVAAHPKS